MPLRLFTRGGGGKARSCPACEGPVDPDATFCPSCYMIFRPEGAADLRQHLQGTRVPADVYLRRKLQTVDPDLGPVVRLPTAESAAPPPATQPAAPLLPGLDSASSAPPSASAPPLLEPAEPVAPPPPAPAVAPAVEPLGPRRSSIRSLADFDAPLPPPARAVEEVAALLAWMLEHDPLIPNNLARLESIHAGVFADDPAARLSYEQHLLLQVTDDLMLHDAQEALQAHLTRVATAYRRAALAYAQPSGEPPAEIDRALWRMASYASRLRLEAWVYQSRHGRAPSLGEGRRARRK